MKNFNRKPTRKEMKDLWDVVSYWVYLTKPSCAESIYQVDRIQENLPVLAERVCDVVGYYPHEDEE